MFVDNKKKNVDNINTLKTYSKAKEINDMPTAKLFKI
jgi:hypothetical protein